MKRICWGFILSGVLLLPAYADIMPVSGYTTSTSFGNATGGSSASGGTWKYASSSNNVTTTYWTVVFNGLQFGNPTELTTPVSLDLGSITLTNLVAVPNGNSQNFTANLNVEVDFTDPAGNIAKFNADTIQLTASPGNGNSDSLSLGYTALPGPQSFRVGNEVYTVTLDGFYQSIAQSEIPAEQLTSLSVSNRNAGPGDTTSANLWGTITAVDPPPVPEPLSIVLLGTLFFGVGLLTRRSIWSRNR